MNNKNPNKKTNLKRDKVYTKEMAKARYEEAGAIKEPFEDPVEAKIQKAMADGDFDNLKGKGKPLDLDKYNHVAEHMRMAYHILRNADYIPEEVQLKKEMELIKEKLSQSESEKEKKELMKRLADVSQQFYFNMEYNKQFNR